MQSSKIKLIGHRTEVLITPNKSHLNTKNFSCYTIFTSVVSNLHLQDEAQGNSLPKSFSNFLVIALGKFAMTYIIIWQILWQPLCRTDTVRVLL